MRFYTYKGRRHTRLYSAFLVGAMAVALVGGAVSVRPAYATTAEEIRDKAKEDLERTEQQIENIKDNQAGVETDLKKAAENLNTLIRLRWKRRVRSWSGQSAWRRSSTRR